MKKIPLTQGQFAIVDDEDFEEVARHKWHACKRLHSWYAERTENGIDGRPRTVEMHRQVMGLTPSDRGIHVDHKNGDGLDCTRGNMRICTARQNQHNSVHNRKAGKTSKYKGVYWHKKGGKWNARIRAGEIDKDGRSKTIHLGLFVDEAEAARAYDDAARRHYGAFAATNFLPEKAAPPGAGFAGAG